MPVGGLLVSQVICPNLRLSSPRLQSTSTAPNSQQQEFDNINNRNSTTNSRSTHQPTAALLIDQSLHYTWKLCRQPGFTAHSARESTSTEITGPKLIRYTGTPEYNVIKVEKRQLWVQPFEWLKLNFASCVVHQTRSHYMAFVN